MWRRGPDGLQSSGKALRLLRTDPWLVQLSCMVPLPCGYMRGAETGFIPLLLITAADVAGREGLLQRPGTFMPWV